MISEMQNLEIIAEESENINERLLAIKKISKGRITDEHFKLLEQKLICDEDWKIKRECAKLIVKHFPIKAYQIIRFVLDHERLNLKLIELYRDLLIQLKPYKKEGIEQEIKKKINCSWDLRAKIEKRIQYYERKIYPESYERNLARRIRNRDLSTIITQELDYVPFLWAKKRWFIFSKDKRTAQYRTTAKIQDQGATHYYVINTWTETVNKARSTGWFHLFHWIRAIVRFKEGPYEIHEFRS